MHKLYMMLLYATLNGHCRIIKAQIFYVLTYVIDESYILSGFIWVTIGRRNYCEAISWSQHSSPEISDTNGSIAFWFSWRSHVHERVSGTSLLSVYSVLLWHNNSVSCVCSMLHNAPCIRTIHWNFPNRYACVCTTAQISGRNKEDFWKCLHLKRWK